MTTFGGWCGVLRNEMPRARAADLKDYAWSARHTRAQGTPTPTSKPTLGERTWPSPRAWGHYLMNSISEYFGSGHKSSATSFSKRSATSRTSSIAGMTVSRM